MFNKMQLLTIFMSSDVRTGNRSLVILFIMYL